VTTVSLGQVLKFAGTPERISRPESEVFVTVKLNCGGAVQRNIKDGKVPVAFTGYRVQPGQFIYSRIDARNGAYALVPDELDGAVVSKDFPVFDVCDDMVDRRYLIHFMRTGRLQPQIRAVSFGATNRQRIAEDQFLAFQFPLPPLDEQRRIAATLDRVEESCLMHLEAAGKYGDFIQAILVAELSDGRWETGSLGMLAEINPKAPTIAEDTEVSFVGMAELNISNAQTESHVVRLFSEVSKGYTIFQQGDILVAKITPCFENNKIGQACLQRPIGVGSTEFHVVRPGEKLNDRFLLYFLRQNAVRREGELRMTGSVGQRRVPSDFLRCLEIPLPPIADQRRIVDLLDHANKVRAEHVAAADGLRELLASVSHQAFSAMPRKK
jgi:hypothetical protein